MLLQAVNNGGPSTLGVAVIVVLGGILTVITTGWIAQRGKKQDYARQDAVANEEKRQREEEAKQREEVAAQASRDRDEQTKQVETVAKLLVAAQEKTRQGTDEVARLAATDGSTNSGMIAITLSYPNGNREVVLLAEVPRVGENIRLSNGAEQPWLTVEHVLWVEGVTPPHVIVSVRPRVNGSPAVSVSQDA